MSFGREVPKYVIFWNILDQNSSNTDPWTTKIGRGSQYDPFDPPSTGFVVDLSGGYTRADARLWSYSDDIKKGKVDTRLLLVKNLGTNLHNNIWRFFLKSSSGSIWSCGTIGTPYITLFQH